MPRFLIIAFCTKSQKEGVNQSDEVDGGGEEVADEGIETELINDGWGEEI